MSVADGSVSKLTENCNIYSYSLQIHFSMINKSLATIVSSAAEAMSTETCSTWHEEIAAISIDSNGKFQFTSRVSIFKKEERNNNRWPTQQHALE
jgi:hypothetical protein